MQLLACTYTNLTQCIYQTSHKLQIKWDFLTVSMVGINIITVYKTSKDLTKLQLQLLVKDFITIQIAYIRVHFYYIC